MASAVPVPTMVPTTFLTVTVALASVTPVIALPAASIVAVRLDGAVVSGATIVFGTVALPALSATVTFKLSPFKYTLSSVIEYLPAVSAVAVPTTIPAAFLTVTTALASVTPVTTLPAVPMLAVKLDGAVVSGAIMVFGAVALPD